MFGIGSTELIVILLVALIVLGPKNLAGISRTLGRIMGEFRRVSTDFQRTLNAEAAADDLREKEEKRKKELAASQATQPAAMTDAMAQAEASSAKPEAKSANAETGEASGANAGQTSQETQATAAKPSGQEDDAGMALAPPPDSPLARALAQTGAEAARAETVIAEAGRPEAKNAGPAEVAGPQVVARTDATTGGKTGASA